MCRTTAVGQNIQNYFTDTDTGIDASREKTQFSIGDWIDCNIINPYDAKCSEITEVGKGGIYMESIRTTQSSYRESNPVEITGTLDGTTWKSNFGADGPNLDSIKKTISIKWKDDAYLPGLFSCQQPTSDLPTDFICRYEQGVVKNVRSKMCGMDFKTLRADTGGDMDCKAQVSLTYNFSSAAYRKLLFSETTGDDYFTLNSHPRDVYFYTGGPAKFIIAGNSYWNEAIRPVVGGKRAISILIRPEISSELSENQVIPKKITLQIPMARGLTITAPGNIKIEQDTINKQTNFILTDFEKDSLELGDKIEFSLTFNFGDNFMADEERRLVDIVGIFDYEVKETRTLKVPIMFDMSQSDVDLMTEPQTLDDHGCGFDATSMETVFIREGVCTSPNCKTIVTQQGGQRVSCTCNTENPDLLDVYCCDAFKCELAASSQGDLPTINSLCYSHTFAS